MLTPAKVDPTRVFIPVRHADRSEMVVQLFAAAEELDVPRAQVRSKSGGFEVPRAIAVHLFPSLYPEG
jgi:hypothetical protein